MPVAKVATGSVLPVLNRIDLRGRQGEALLADLPRPNPAGDAPLAAVRDIIAAVRSDGDAALQKFTAQFDGVDAPIRTVDARELKAALENCDPTLRNALEEAAQAIVAFHNEQVQSEHVINRKGIVVRGRQQAVDRAGCYVPGGRGSYPSSVLMTVIPARVAGVNEIVLCVPPDRESGKIADITLAAAAIAGVDEVYAVGGAQAIAAMAYGTETIRPVDVIAGPGNAYVAMAKREVAGQVGVPMAFAGPSEIVVVADSSAPVDFVAIDLMVQAEHGPDGLAWLVTTDAAVADAVDAALAKLVSVAPRQKEISSTFASGGFCALVDSQQDVIDVVNFIAAEHVELICADAEQLANAIRHAGAVFIGPLSPASIGDYVAGPSHVLPTFGSARFGSALTVSDFAKTVHIVEVTDTGFAWAAPLVAAIADAEGFATHAESVRLRQRELGDT